MPKILCVTNNPRWRTLAAENLAFVDGSAFDVFQRARNLVHQGWRFLGHPLYGNFNPAKIPYRTLLLQGPLGVEGAGPIDIESFAMLEKALEQFRTLQDNTSDPPQIPERIRRDYETLDHELMKETVARYVHSRRHERENSKEEKD